MEAIRIGNVSQEDKRQKEMDRYAKTITAQIILLQQNVSRLTDTVGNLRTDVQVLKALMERMEQDLNGKSDSN